MILILYRTKTRTSFITDETEPDDIDSFISESTSPIMFDTLSQHIFTSQNEKFVRKGSYLGYFTDDDNSKLTYNNMIIILTCIYIV